MRSSFLLVILSLLWFTVNGQKPVYSPRVLFLTPKIDYDLRFEKEMQEIGENLVTYFPDEDTKEQPKNIQQTMNSLSKYTRTVKASGIVPLIICQRMLFTMFRGERNFIVLMDTLSVYGTADELKRIADVHDVQHIVYFPEVKLYYEDTVGFASMKMAVYDRYTNKVSLEFENSEDWFVEEYENPELCDSQTATCLLFNSSLHSWFRILETLWDTNQDALERIREARETREENPFDDPLFEIEDDPSHKQAVFDYISDNYFHGSPNTAQLERLLRTAGSPFSTPNSYRVFFNPDSTQFVAFVIEPDAGHVLFPRYISPVEADAEVFQSPDKSIASGTRADFVGSVLLGIYEDSTWYTDKRPCNKFRSRTEEEARLLFLYNLYYWHFFEYGSTKPSAEFWSTDETEPTTWLFARVEKPMSIDPYPYTGLKAWDKKRPHRTSFEYLTTVEANHIVREMASFEESFKTKVLNPFYKTENHFLAATTKPSLIYTGMRDIVIHPAVFVDENTKNQLRYMVFFENDPVAYEWTYFPSAEITEVMTAEEMARSQLNTVTVFSLEPYPVVRDQRFWDQLILAKDGGGYRYLKPLH